MWIATADGLNRYDGVEMKIYKPEPEKKTGFRGRTIRSKIMEDNQEQLRFSTEIATYTLNKRGGYFQEHFFRESDEKIFRLSANPIYQEGSNIWFANSATGVIEYNTRKNQMKIFALTDSAGSLILFRPDGVPDGRDRLWFASNKGLFAFHIREKKWQQFLLGGTFSAIAFNENKVYASSGKNIFYFNIISGQTGQFSMESKKSDIVNGDIRALYADPLHNIWAGDESGNVYLKSNHESFFNWEGNINGPGAFQTAYPIYCFYADEQGTLWVGADVLGLLRAPINRSGFKTYPKPEDKKAFFVTSVYEDENEKVWIGTYKIGLLLLDKITNNTTAVPLPGLSPHRIQETTIGFIKKDIYRNLWVATEGNLFVKEKGEDSFKKLEIPLPKNALVEQVSASSITEYKNGWLIGTSVGPYKMGKKGNEYSLEYLSELGQSKVSVIWIDAEDKIWVAFESRGLFVATSIEQLRQSKMLFSETGIKALLFDESNNLLWISTTSGLIASHLPTGKYRIFTEADGLGNSYVYGALKNENDLWLSTNRGLSKATINFIANKVIPELSFTHFTANDGLPDDEFNTGAFYKGASGDFYFGTIKGLVWFNPNEIKSNQYLPQLVITDILVNGVVADSLVSPEYLKQLLLPYFKNSLYFRFRGLEFTNATQVTYAYQLKGWDNDWVQSGLLNEVRYNNLPPGDYDFRVRAANASGLWNNEAYSVSVTIHPPFWGTWLFYSLVSLSLIGLIILITKNIVQRRSSQQLAELKQQMELDKERQRISREMHDDIGAGLTQIVLMSESVKNKSVKKDTRELDEITGISRQLVSSMSEIIWSLNPENKTLEQFCAYLREMLHRQLEYSGIAYKIILPENGDQVVMTGQQRRNILLLIKEMVNNAIKHSKAKNIAVKADVVNNGISFCVQDDGTGFDTEKNHQGNGLKNTQSRIKELGSVLKVESQSGVGTQFEFFVQLKGAGK